MKNKQMMVWSFAALIALSGVSACGSDPAGQAPATYSISGTVTQNAVGIPGVTMNLYSTPTSTRTTTTDAGGHYAFNGLYNGTYEITYSQASTTIIFSPTVYIQVISGASVSIVNFTAP